VHCVAGNHQFLFGGDEGHFYLGIGCGDEGLFAECHVGFVVQFYAQIAEVLADAAAEPAVVLADACGEDDEVYAVEGCDIRSDEFDDVVGELLEHELGPGVACVGCLVKFAGVGTDAAEAQEAALLVHYVGHLIGGDVVLLHEVGDYIAVHIAAAGSHNHAFQRGEAHGGVDALAVEDGRYGGSVADVAGDNLGVVDVQTAEAGTLAGYILVRCAVGAVAAYMVVGVVLVRKGVHVGVVRHGLVEGGVEHYHLRNAGEYMRNCVNTKQMRGVVERCEVAADLNLLEDIFVYENAATEEVGTLHNAVANCLYIVKTLQDSVLGVDQSVHHELHSHCVVGDGECLGEGLFACGFVGDSTFGKGDFFYKALSQNVIDIIALHIKKLVLDGGAAAIDY